MNDLKSKKLRLLTLIPLLLILPLSTFAQVQPDLPAGDPVEFYYRVLQLSGHVGDNASFALRPFTPVLEISGQHPWMEHWDNRVVNGYKLPLGLKIAFFEPVWFQSYNTTLPRGFNDGAIWQGKGYNTALSAGLMANWGPLHIRFQPQVGLVQNADFDLGDLPTPYGVDEYSTPIRFIDNVRRFGPAQYSWFDLGDSFAELRIWGMKAGFSNARFWTGPAIHNPLFFSYNAPGFLHVHIGTYRPLDTQLGSFEFKYQYGALQKSDWLDNRLRDNLNAIVSIHFTYSPSFMDGLTIGVNRLFMDRYPKEFSNKWSQAKRVFEAALKENLQTNENPEGQSESNQMASIYFRWMFPHFGFETYGELGRNDYNVDWRDFRMQPDHHRAYLLGILKSIELSDNRLLSLGLETTQLNANRSTFTRGGEPWQRGALGRWYLHRPPNFGFTNQGQILGAGIGAVSQSQQIYTNYYYVKGSYGFQIQRISYSDVFVDEDIINILRINEKDIDRWEVRNIELMTGLSATRFLTNGLEIAATLDLSYIMNHNYVKENDKVNVRFEISLRKRLAGWLR